MRVAYARGGFNVPAGRYRNPCILDEPALRRASRVLGLATLRTGDFLQALCDVAPGDFVYVDPPYVPLTPSSSFTSYTASGFALGDQQRLAAHARALVARGVTVMASNHDLPIVRQLYRGFKAVPVTRAQAINSNTSRRGRVRELVLVGRPS